MGARQDARREADPAGVIGALEGRDYVPRTRRPVSRVVPQGFAPDIDEVELHLRLEAA